MGSKGATKYYKHQQYHRDAASLHTWVTSQLPSYVEKLTPYLFEHQILGTNKPWLVLFYAPWCGHCTRFEPEYEDVARMLRGEVSVGKVNCEKYGGMCNKAAVRGYPTLRYYKGTARAGDNDVEAYTSKDISERDADKLHTIVKQLVRDSDDIKPVYDKTKIPPNEDVIEETTDYEEFDEFQQYYDEESFSYHDEL